MNGTISLDAPIRTLIAKALSLDTEAESVFGRTKNKDLFFQDLLALGFDFFELLELFVNCDGVTEKSVQCISDNVINAEVVTRFNDKELRKMIPHWTASPYHSASISEVCSDLKELVKNNTNGTFVYRSNLNLTNKKTHNDTYVLIINENVKYFFDINRRKSFRLCDKTEDVKNDKRCNL